MRLLVLLLILCSFSVPANADDWPHWMGPTRDNVWHEEDLLDRFPEEGPTIVWRTPLAGGYAGPAVAGGKVFVTDYVTAEKIETTNFERDSFSGIERIHCLDEKTGEPKWDFQYEVNYDISYPAGPRCTPTVDEDKVYTLGAVGHLYCFNVQSGDVIWSKDLTKEYGTKPALWGYASHPLIDGEKLICIVGGEGTHAVAFNKQTGKEIWRTLTASEQGYSPPTIIQSGGTRQLILLRPDAVSSVNPETGEEFWSVPYEGTSGSIIMSPIYWNNYLYVGGYNKKCLMLKLSAERPAAEVVWGNKPRHGISPINVQPFLDDGTMYGFDQNGMLMAIELPSGKRLWETAAPVAKRRLDTGTAFLIKQAERYWMFNERGEVLIAKLSPTEGYEEIDRYQVIEPTGTAFGRNVVWCMPALANRRMYVRNDKEIICVDLSAK